MRILAFDCAGAQCAAALLADGKVLAARSVLAERGHAQLLIPMLSDLLGEAGLAFGDIDRFAVTTGPGSFTGIRVALAAAHGLALGTAKPIVGVTVFEAMAAATPGVASRLLVAIEELAIQMARIPLQQHATQVEHDHAPRALAPAHAARAWGAPSLITRRSSATDSSTPATALIARSSCSIDSTPSYPTSASVATNARHQVSSRPLPSVM